jgi:hypothetical protein
MPIQDSQQKRSLAAAKSSTRGTYATRSNPSRSVASWWWTSRAAITRSPTTT